MKFCSDCGSARVVQKVPAGDNVPRFICEECHLIHYQNPKIVTGCLPVWEDKVLLCKRAIKPRYGLWTLPAGFMENNESVEQAAIRETWEEAQAKVEQLSLYMVLSLPHISQVYMMFRTQLCDMNFAPGIESLEVQLFHQKDIPWNDLAFPVIHRTLTHYVQDYVTGQFPLHVGDIIKTSCTKHPHFHYDI